MNPRAFLFVPALVIFSSTARAQDLFAPRDASEDPPAAAPAPAPAPTPEAPAAPAPDTNEWWRAKPRPPRAHKPAAIRFDGAYAPRRLFSLGVTGADLGLAIGVQTTQHGAWWGTSRVSYGSTENGLTVWSTRFGAEYEVVFDPIRIGIGASVFAIGVDRAARDQTLLSFGVEGRTFARVDCMRSESFAMFLRAGLDAATEASSGSVFWGPAIGLGFELGLAGKRPAEWGAATPITPRL